MKLKHASLCPLSNPVLIVSYSLLPSSLLLKVCQVLKNRSRDVRDIGRSTLVKMATSLGPKYLKYIIKEMKESLTRGYQLHVLGYSLHSLLHGVSSTLESGSLDPCLEVVNEVGVNRNSSSLSNRTSSISADSGRGLVWSTS